MSKVIKYASEIRKMQAYHKNIAVMKLYGFTDFIIKYFLFAFLMHNEMLLCFEIKYGKILVL